MDLHNYTTGETIRTLTEAEVARYMAEIADDTTGTGAVDGASYGMPGVSVYAV